MPEIHFGWTAEYSVGNQTLDDQHKAILQICTKIQSLDQSDPGYMDKMHLALNDLTVLSSKHFEDEERILAEIAYPDIESQRVEHEHYHEQFIDFLMDAIDGNPDSGKISKFLEEWWLDHIINSDMKYKPFLKSRS